MHLATRAWSCVAYLANLLTLSTFDPDVYQKPIGGHDPSVIDTHSISTSSYPIFPPPGGSPGDQFECEYPDMPDYEFCGDDPEDRGCWLRPKDKSKKGLRTYNIFTDYETFAPRGKDRHYDLTISDGVVNADGLPFTQAKLVNGKYPGPWIQACWGDRIIAKVINKMKYNGTSVHWHGIRQLESMQMDGVPGITQCPIAPQDSFTYNFTTTQYGSAWYHSHYSVQYADGLLGPLTIHGPHSGNFDHPKAPLLMTDWFHNSAYQVIHGKTPGYPTILLNGIGNISRYDYATLDNDRDRIPVTNKTVIPDQYRLHFNATKIPANPWDVMRPQRYLLRLINTAFDTTFVFSIDHHRLLVVSADFVPIHNYSTTHLHVGIGQRYNVIVEAEPEDYDIPGYEGHLEKHFWIRTTVSPCFGAGNKIHSLQGYDETGVLTYKDIEFDDPSKPRQPTTRRWADIPDEPKCQDEDIKNLVPVHKWQVGPPSNKDSDWNGENDIGERFDVVGSFMFKDPAQKPPFNPKFPLALFSIERPKTKSDSFIPMQIDYNDSMILHLDDKKPFQDKWAVVTETRKPDSWIYLAIAGRHKDDKSGVTTGGAHPMHLHGHDFAILQQEGDKELNSSNINLNKNNPARRDVVLLPQNGFVVIAFKVDNPGSWIMHCHIAFHASFGLALQILENQAAANDLWPPHSPTIDEAERVCNNWRTFQDDCTLHYPGYNKKFDCYPACNNQTSVKACPNIFQDDSGI